MNKFKTFIIFIILVAVWATFFATIKFYMWWVNWVTLDMDLQKVAWYLSLWSVFAFLVWWAFASTFLKKYYLFVISVLSLLFVSIWYFFWFENSFSFALVVTLLWFLYWLWNVVKSVIIAIEIKKTWLPETLVNALVWITFVVFIIIWSVVWSLLFEKLWKEGYLVIMWLLAFASIASFNLDYDKVSFTSLVSHGWWKYLFERKESLKQAIKAYIPDLKYILKNYSFIIITSSFLWTVSTIVAQSSVEYSTKTFNIETSVATFILFYSAIWAIVWNLLSVKMNKNRWKYFIIFNVLFSFVIISFSFLATTFIAMKILAVILWLFFWVSSNLVDSFLLKTIWDEDKKEYWASTFWLVFSMILFSMMFTSSFILEKLWYWILMILLWIIMMIIWGLLYRKQIKIK